MKKILKKHSPQSAFTLLELVFVIVVTGILAAVIISNTRTNPVQEAAIQLVNHIRYTQHLAMMDDKFDVDDKWYEERWQVRFTSDGIAETGYTAAYAVFSDWMGMHSGDPNNLDELAKDPLTGNAITGGVTNNVLYGDPGVFSKANLGIYYGIKNITFSSSCQYHRSMRIAFDHFARPIKGNIGSPSVNSNIDSLKLITQRCEITLQGDTESVTIGIDPETGYTRIL
mgnify:FL=1